MNDEKPTTVDQMKAGRELDALMAERVMGWRAQFVVRPHTLPLPSNCYGLIGSTEEPPLNVMCGCGGSMYLCGRHFKELSEAAEPPRYSSDIAAAWQVVEKMHERGEMLSLVYGELTERGTGEWEACFRFSTVAARAETPALAICRAALLVSGGRSVTQV